MIDADVRAWKGDAAEARTQVIRELGDVLWYATTALHRVDQSATEAVSRSAMSSQWHDDSLVMLQARGAEFAGVVKKALFYGRGIESSRRQIVWILGDCIKLVTACARRYGASLGDVQRANVEKLRARFASGGFTAAEANARADEAAR